MRSSKWESSTESEVWVILKWRLNLYLDATYKLLIIKFKRNESKQARQ